MDVKENTALFFFILTVLGAMQGVEYSTPFSYQKSLICMNNLLSSILQNNSSSCLGKKGGCLLLFVGYSVFSLGMLVPLY